MKKRRFLAMLLCICMMSGVFPQICVTVSASDTYTSGGYSYQINEDNITITLTGYSGLGGNVNIPNSINGYPVTTIAPQAFYNCSNIINVTIPNSVTAIHVEAFRNCNNLVTISIPNSVAYIGNSAFYECTSLTSITLPNSITYINNSMFSKCSNLTSITIPNSVTYIGDSVFSQCTSLKTISLPTGITSIGSGTFLNCTSLTNIIIPNNVTTIGNAAFTNCINMENLKMSNRITSIGIQAFYKCSNLVSVVIPNNVISVEDSAFQGCSKLTSIYFTGDIPTNFGTNVFTNTTSSFTIYYIEGKSGWTSPMWNGYPTAPFTPSETPQDKLKKSYNQYVVEEFIEKFYQTDKGIGEQLFFDEYTTAKMIAESESEDFSYFKAWVYNITNDAKTNVKSVLFKKSYYQTEIVKPLIQAILSDIPKNNEITEDLNSAKDNIDEVDKIKSYLDKVYEKYDDHVTKNIDLGIVDEITECKVTQYNYQILRDDKMSELFGKFTGVAYDYLTGVLKEYINYQKIKLSAELIHFDLLAEYFLDDREAYDIIMNLKESYTDEMLALSYYSIEFIMGQAEDKIIDLLENSAEGFLNYVCANINNFLISIGKGALIPKFTLSPILKTLSAVDFIRGELFDMTGLSDYASDSKNLTLFYWLNQSIKFDLVHSVYNYIQGDDSYESADKIVALYDLWRGSQIYMNKCAENITSDIYQKTILEEEINFIKSINIENWRRSKYYANSNILRPDYTELSTSKYGIYYKILLEGYNNDSTSELWSGKDGLLSYWDDMNSYQKYKISKEIKQLIEFSKSDNDNSMYTVYLLHSNTYIMSNGRGMWAQKPMETSILITNSKKMGIYIRNIEGDLYSTFRCKTFNILSKEEVTDLLEGSNGLPEDVFLIQRGNILKSIFNGVSWESEIVTCVMNSVNNYIAGKQYVVATEYVSISINSTEYEIFLKTFLNKKYYGHCYAIEGEINIIFDEIYDIKLYPSGGISGFSQLISGKNPKFTFAKYVTTKWFDIKGN